MEVISLVISIVAIVLSLINVIYLLFTNRKKIDFNIRNYTFKEESNSSKKIFYLFNVEFINKSRQPISITSVSFIGDKDFYYVDLEPQRVVDKTKTSGREIIEKKNLDSADFPINLTSLTAVRKVLIMYSNEIFGNKVIKVVINTNRGKVRKKINVSEKYFTISDFTRTIGF